MKMKTADTGSIFQIRCSLTWKIEFLVTVAAVSLITVENFEQKWRKWFNSGLSHFDHSFWKCCRQFLQQFVML